MSDDRFSRWIFESYRPTAEGLALFRIFAAMMILFFLMPDATYYTDLAKFPDDFFSPPPGPMMLVGVFPPAWFFYTIHTLLVVSLIGVLLGYKTRISSLMSTLFMLILLGFIFSIGKVNHMMLLILLPAVMAFSNWGGAYSIDAHYLRRKTQAEGWPLVLLALFIGFMMFTAGFAKILGGWLHFDTFATQGHLLNQYFVRGRTELLSGLVVEINQPWIWGVLDWATVMFEAGFLLAAMRAGWTRLFVSFAVLFHFSTMLTLNIAFLVNFPAYAAFLPWNKINGYLKSRIPLIKKTDSLPLVFGGTLFLLFTVIKVIDKSAVIMPVREPSFNEITIIGIALIIVIALGIGKARELVTTVRS
jgi:hypothetical protein